MEVFRRQPGGDWLLSEAAGLDAACSFDAVGCRIALANIYGKVTFETADLIPPRPPAV